MDFFGSPLLSGEGMGEGSTVIPMMKVERPLGYVFDRCIRGVVASGIESNESQDRIETANRL